MDWVHEKNLRNSELSLARNMFETRLRTACVICLPPRHPHRPTTMPPFKSVGGFKRHPNAKPEM